MPLRTQENLKGTNLINRLSQQEKKHFDEAIRKVKPSVNKTSIENYKKIEDNYIKTVKAAVPSSESYLG